MLFARNNNNMCNIAFATFYPIVANDSSSSTPSISSTITSNDLVSSTTTTTTTPSPNPAKLMYSYGPSSGDISIAKNDDSSYGPIKIGLKIPFFSKFYITQQFILVQTVLFHFWHQFTKISHQMKIKYLFQ